MLAATLATLLTTLILASATAQPGPAADVIARRAQDRDTGRDSRMTMRMKLFDRQNRSRERALTMESLRGRGTPGAATNAPQGDRLLIRFTYPNDIRGTGFLVWEHPDREDERKEAGTRQCQKHVTHSRIVSGA